MEFKIEHFKKLIAQNKLSHAYIFFGEGVADALELSKQLVNFLENGEGSQERNVLVDALFIENPETSIGIDIVRNLKKFLWQKPIKSKKRTIVISGAENLTAEAQNVILKITEEPPKTALIILITRNTESLPPTIVSRLQKEYFHRVPSSAKITEDGTRANGRAKKLVVEFLGANSYRKQEIAKKIAEAERDGEVNLATSFLDALIVELSKNELKNSDILREIMKRRRFLGDYSLNKRLQLAFLATLW